MTVSEQEREKYLRIWARPEYREHSPGMRHVVEFLSRIENPAADTVIDLGCGTGRAARHFADSFKRVYGLDICNALDENVEERVHFVEACLWEPLPAWMHQMTFDWFYCTDVMEHIPGEYVGTTLDTIAALCRKGGFFSIAHFEDGCGRLIGQTLHMTVEPPDWWHKQIEQRWQIQEWTGTSTSFVFVRRRANGKDN